MLEGDSYIKSYRFVAHQISERQPKLSGTIMFMPDNAVVCIKVSE